MHASLDTIECLAQIGHAAKTQAASALDLFQDPSIISRAKAELLGKRGEPFQYEALLGDIPPPLDYRKDYWMPLNWK